MKCRISPLVLLLAASGAFAQAMYKSTMPDGKVIYGEKPAPGAQRVETIASPPPKTGITVVTPAEKTQVDERIRQRSAAENAKQRELDDARRQLQQAETALEAGKEPLPGERIGTAGGASRLTDAYFERQKKLEQAVESARARLEKAQQAAR
ncbi:MAG: hypothetical protein A3F74_10415 [Betaproteobacteria bacterium RIFCSPLOWO2_12_FULL_62_58]|nr:MAG: hypothetical protein A3F74_10415 [Betaproteobacteria bacterium RIFCSPLOWO2_12_FULL_62_58]